MVGTATGQLVLALCRRCSTCTVHCNTLYSVDERALAGCCRYRAAHTPMFSTCIHCILCSTPRRPPCTCCAGGLIQLRLE
ncbi:hypothetical protein PF010_g23259 [Phytophthora fragariae]|uniref:Uncharacterized protein n=1 Tax=Phytophthora fragariae TaxID=53985 RepID=A0A6G0K6X8_9STRA|nr:hypothetical protein PF010_g23259 [Phytophthora fragariae]KAE9361209.1 hypothetical protein PF008_g1243 [Phytophthora fragariae]